MKYLKYLFFIIYCFTDSQFILDIDTDKNFIMPRNIYAYDYDNGTSYKIVSDFHDANDERIIVVISHINNHSISFNNSDYYYFFAYDDTKADTQSSNIDTVCQNYIKEFFSVISSHENRRNLLLVYDEKCLWGSKKNNRIAFFFKCKKSSY